MLVLLVLSWAVGAAVPQWYWWPQCRGCSCLRWRGRVLVRKQTGNRAGLDGAQGLGLGHVRLHGEVSQNHAGAGGSVRTVGMPVLLHCAVLGALLQLGWSKDPPLPVSWFLPPSDEGGCAALVASQEQPR